jgi:hypothetical protein
MGNVKVGQLPSDAAAEQIVGREPPERVSHDAFINQSWRHRPAASTQPFGGLLSPRKNFMTCKIFAIVFVLVGTTVFVHGQTSSELRAKCGQPQMTGLEKYRPSVERFLVRPNILMTIRYTERGEPCEAQLEAVPNSTPKTGRPEHAPEGDYMSTVEVIELINELVPTEKRGKKIRELFVNGGDHEMKLHHPGCTGLYLVTFENLSVSAASWCWGGTFSATIHWGKTTCHAQTTSK